MQLKNIAVKNFRLLHDAGLILEKMAALLAGRRKRSVPIEFSVRDIGYTHGKADFVPE